MAIEQSGAEAAPEQAQEGQGAQADQEGQGSAPGDIDELKRKFREALDRKRDAHASAEGARDTGKVHGSHGPAVSRRSFRRKSGG
jgi:Family of unknown function (DUF5302)